MEPVVAVYDACVLYSAFLRDFLVRLAIHGRGRGVLRAKWTGRIHREWIAIFIEDSSQPRARIGAIHVMLHVLFARADQFDRPAHRSGCVHRLHHEVGNDLAAEAAAQKRDMNSDVLGGAARSLRDASWHAVTD